METVHWLLIGIILLVLGFIMMTQIHRENGEKKITSAKNSVLISILCFILEIVLAIVSDGLFFALSFNFLSVLSFIVGFFMTVINFLKIVHVLH